MVRSPKNPTWNLQDAKAKFSEVVDLAQSGKPQIILRRGVPAAAVISVDAYRAMQPRTSLISFLLRSPLMGSDLDLSHAQEAYEPRTDLFDRDAK